MKCPEYLGKQLELQHTATTATTTATTFSHLLRLREKTGNQVLRIFNGGIHEVLGKIGRGGVSVIRFRELSESIMVPK